MLAFWKCHFPLPVIYRASSPNKHCTIEQSVCFDVHFLFWVPCRLWVHCVTLYIISAVACILLYIVSSLPIWITGMHISLYPECFWWFILPIIQEYKHIARLKLLHLTSATPKPNHFTVLVRGIPKADKESCSDVVDNFFTKYHSSSYLFHQVVYKVGKVQKIMVLNTQMHFTFSNDKHLLV